MSTGTGEQCFGTLPRCPSPTALPHRMLRRIPAGARHSQMAVLPRGRETVAWQLVAVSAGSLALPAVRITAPGLDATLDASWGRRVFVAPPAAAA